MGGWYDLFLSGRLRDCQALRAAGHEARLTVGPWTHTARGVFAEGAAQTLEFGLAHARGEPPPRRPPVRRYVMGEEAWRDVESWPPPGCAPQRFHLQPGAALSPEEPAESAPDRYRYDPADPPRRSAGCGCPGRPAGWTCSPAPPPCPGRPSAVILPVRRPYGIRGPGGQPPTAPRISVSNCCAVWSRG